MAEDGDSDLGFTFAQQEWIQHLVDSQRDANVQFPSSSTEPLHWLYSSHFFVPSDFNGW